MVCCLFEKSQYIGKSEYSLNLRTNGPPCDKPFQMSGHNFNAHAKFTIIEQVSKKSLSKSKILSLLERAKMPMPAH